MPKMDAIDQAEFDADLEERQCFDEMNPIYGGLSSDAWKSCAFKQAVEQEMDPDEEFCTCRNGWLCSDFDTWHECRYHYTGQRHPDAPYEDEIYSQQLEIDCDISDDNWACGTLEVD